jgi:hypothetical protein
MIMGALPASEKEKGKKKITLIAQCEHMYIDHYI